MKIHAPILGERWGEEIQARGLGRGAAVERMVRLFAAQLLTMLPHLLGPQREQVEHLWVRASELFGNMGARRGLAAGEVIEEFHMLRELVILDLYRDPPLEGGVSLREILRLSRALDRAVIHANVAHTDTMFFHIFEGNGSGSPTSSEEIAAEAEAQLAVIASEFRAIFAGSPKSSGA